MSVSPINHSQSQLRTHSMHPSAVILTLSVAKRKDLHLFFRHSSDPMLCGNQQVRSRTDRDSNPSTPGSSIRSAQSSLRVSSPSVPSPAQSLSGCTESSRTKHLVDILMIIPESCRLIRPNGADWNHY